MQPLQGSLKKKSTKTSRNFWRKNWSSSFSFSNNNLVPRAILKKRFFCPLIAKRCAANKSSIQLVGIGTFWSFRTFLVKKSYTKILTSFRIILNFYAQFLTKNVLIPQNVLIPPNCILPTHSSSKYFNTFILYTTDAFFNKLFQ